MKARPEVAPTLSVREAQAQLVAARAQLAELQDRAAGSIEHRTTRREQHTVIRQTGRAEVVDVDVPHVETEHVGPLGRLRARRALADAEDRVALAEERLEEARLAATRDARVQRAEAIAAGEASIRRVLPDLLREVRTLQERLQAFHGELERLDRPLGQRYFAELAGCPLVGELLGVWLTQVTSAFLTEQR
jgi:hypothetical protein